MTFFLHSAIRIDSLHFEPRGTHRVEALGGGAEACRHVAETQPHGVSRCLLGVGGFQYENLRYRGFTGQMPRAPHFMDLEHAKLYASELAYCRRSRTEDQALAAGIGAVCGSLVGLMGLGIACFFTTNPLISTLPASMILPGAVAGWLPYRKALLKKEGRLEALLAMVRGLEDPGVPAVWVEAQETARACQSGDDPLLSRASLQFFDAKDQILPRYDELGIPLPEYEPPDEDSPLAAMLSHYESP